MNQFAVIDLGTNTFHLLIAIVEKGEIKEQYRKRKFVNLAEGGISKISNEAYQRGIKTIEFFAKKLENYQVADLQVFGTAALRTASNGENFIKEVYDRTRLHVQIIDGLREAELIFKGTTILTELSKSNHLIMDIGGGSVEFIIAGQNHMQWRESYPIGVTVLYNLFHATDPISNEEHRGLLQFLDSELQSLKKALELHPCNKLIGASGSFEVLQKMLIGRLYKSRTGTYSKDDFEKIYHVLLPSTLQERLQMTRLLKERAKLVVVAFILMSQIIKIAKIDTIIVSPYAMKEGALAELANI